MDTTVDFPLHSYRPEHSPRLTPLMLLVARLLFTRLTPASLRARGRGVL